MSKRSEQRGLEALPPRWRDSKDRTREIDSALPVRKFYIRAYEQAEKDLALTIEDMERIHTFLYAIKNNKSGMFTFTRLSDGQYEEALRRFNEWRKNND